MSTTAVVVAGGRPPAADTIDVGDALVVAADSGLDRAREIGLAVDLVVGDLDSVTPEALEAARAAGVVVETHPADKDATDLELALEACVARGATRVTVLALDGGRSDHWLANVALLCSPRWHDIEMSALSSTSGLAVVRGRRELRRPVGSILTLLAWDGPATGVRVEGLRWNPPDTLPSGVTIGVSNEVTAVPVTVEVADGVVLAVWPLDGTDAGGPG